MKLLTLVYDEALDNQITPILQRGMPVTRYSKIEGVVGARMDALAASEYASERRNNMIFVIADDETIAQIVTVLRELRERVGQGIRGIVTNAEAVI